MYIADLLIIRVMMMQTENFTSVCVMHAMVKMLYNSVLSGHTASPNTVKLLIEALCFY